MYFNAFDSDVVKDWIKDVAKGVADEFRGMAEVNEDDFSTRVFERVNDTITYAPDQLALVAHYGLSEACVGGVDMEDSPVHKFETDVFELAQQLLENEGIALVW